MGRRRSASSTRWLSRGRATARRRLLLDNFRRTGNITLACEAAGVQRNQYYVWKEHVPGFVEAFAKPISRRPSASRPRRGAVLSFGVTRERPLLYQGQVVTTEVITEYSDQLLMFLLRARKPEVYRDCRDVRFSGAEEYMPLAELLGAIDADSGAPDPE
jgi:hypothetical protein